MDPKVADTLRHVFILAVIAAIGIFGYKLYNRYDAKVKLVADFRASSADAVYFHAINATEAKATYLKNIGRLEKAHQMGIEPNEFLDLVYTNDKKIGSEGPSTREKLVRNTSVTAYERAKQLHMLDDPSSLPSLLAGEMPIIVPSPVFGYTVDPALSPGIESIVPNLVLLPETYDFTAPPTDVQVAAFRQLLYDLTDAGIIDPNAQRRIFNEYGPTKPPAPKPAPEKVETPKPQPKPAPEPAPEPAKPAEPEQKGYVPDKPADTFVLPK